jgi:hypothetical protein
VAQNRYFRSLLIYWSPKGADWRIPILPGGYLLGGLLLINLIAAHIKRFTFTKKKIGIFLIHAGLILLLLGQFTTDFLQVESHMRLGGGEVKNYSESDRISELVLIDSANADHDRVVAIPETILGKEKQIRHPQLPFTFQVKQYYPNSRLSRRAPMVDTDPPPATQGAGQHLKLEPAAMTFKMDERNVPSAVVEILTPQGSLGTWLVSRTVTRLVSVTTWPVTFVTWTSRLQSPRPRQCPQTVSQPAVVISPKAAYLQPRQMGFGPERPGSPSQSVPQPCSPTRSPALPARRTH